MIFGKPLIAAIAATALCFGLWTYERMSHKATLNAWAAETAQLKADYQVEIARLQSVNREVERIYIPKVEYVRGETRTVVKEVPTYVTVEDDRACPSTLGITRLHDRALGADGVPADRSAGSPDDRPAAAPLSEIAATVAGNYGACREYRLRAEALMQWARMVAR